MPKNEAELALELLSLIESNRAIITRSGNELTIRYPNGDIERINLDVPPLSGRRSTWRTR